MAWVRTWRATDPVPEAAVANLPAAVAAADAACASASPKSVAVAIGRLIGWISRNRLYRFSEDPDEARTEAADITRDFRAALADLPDDLLERAVEGIVATHKFRNLPLASEIREIVADDLTRRYDLQRGLRSAEFVVRKLGRVEADPYRVERSEQELAGAAAMVEAVNRLEVAPKAMPAERSDTKPEEVDRREAIRRVMAESKGFRRIPKPGERREGEATHG